MNEYKVFVNKNSVLKSFPKSKGFNIKLINDEIPVTTDVVYDNYHAIEIIPTANNYVIMLPLNTLERPVHLMDQCHLRQLNFSIKCNEENPKIILGLTSFHEDKESNSDFVVINDYKKNQKGWCEYEIPLYKFVPIEPSSEFDLRYTQKIIIQGKDTGTIWISNIKFIQN